jgi:hypothetical protein
MLLHKKNICLTLCFLLCNIILLAQANYKVIGRVIKETDGAVLPNTSVFAQNTTIGTVTNTEGDFTLYLPNGGYELAFSYTGYITESVRVTNTETVQNIIVKLKEKQKELESVSVVASNEVLDGNEKYGKFFKEEFLGKTLAAQQCTIENPEVLHYFFSKKRNRLKITATEAVIIKNMALGYQIKYNLDSFTHEYKTETSVFTGFPLYENMPGDSLQQITWKVARAAAYKGSMLHFMRSLYYKTLKENNFAVQFIVKQNNKDVAIKLSNFYAALGYNKDDSLQTVDILPTKNNIGILYLAAKPVANYLSENPTEPTEFRFSLLNLSTMEGFTVEQNGYFYDQNDVTVSGYWSWEKVADQLPYNYVLE